VVSRDNLLRLLLVLRQQTLKALVGVQLVLALSLLRVNKALAQTQVKVHNELEAFRKRQELVAGFP
jgi:hypothetical protein